MAAMRVRFGCWLCRTAACLPGPQWILSECVLGAKFLGPQWLHLECVLAADRGVSSQTAMDTIRGRFGCQFFRTTTFRVCFGCWLFRTAACPTAMDTIRVRFWCCFHGPRHIFPDRTGCHCFASWVLKLNERHAAAGCSAERGGDD